MIGVNTEKPDAALLAIANVGAEIHLVETQGRERQRGVQYVHTHNNETDPGLAVELVNSQNRRDVTPKKSCWSRPMQEEDRLQLLPPHGQVSQLRWQFLILIGKDVTG
jgi:hypothetical protein